MSEVVGITAKFRNVGRHRQSWTARFPSDWKGTLDLLRAVRAKKALASKVVYFELQPQPGLYNIRAGDRLVGTVQVSATVSDVGAESVK